MLVNANNLLGIFSMLLIIIIKYTIFKRRRFACMESSSNSRSREFALLAQLLSIREEQISTYVRLVRFEIGMVRENSRQWKHHQRQKSQQTRRPMNSEAVVHCIDRQSASHSELILRSRTTWQVTQNRNLISTMENLLYVPNRGKTPAKLDRAKLLAASALAANSG